MTMIFDTPEPFNYPDFCDGGFCERKKECARYMGNCDVAVRPPRGFVVMNRPWPLLCPFQLDIPHPDYPYKDNGIQD